MGGNGNGNGRGNGRGNNGSGANTNAVLFLVTLFLILMVLLLILAVFVVQTYAIWRLSAVVVAQNTDDDTEKRKSTRIITVTGTNTSSI